MSTPSDTIKFYDKKDEYYCFANTAECNPKLVVHIGDGQYKTPSSEAIFQALRGMGANANPNDAKRAAEDKARALQIIKSDAVGRKIQLMGQTINKDLYNNDYPYNSSITVKEQVMFEVLLIKFTQNLDLLQKLLETGNRKIEENTASAGKGGDWFWGNAPTLDSNGKLSPGKNALGKNLMAVRDLLLTELTITGSITPRWGFSNELCQVLGLPYRAERHLNTGNKIVQNSDGTFTVKAAKTDAKELKQDFKPQQQNQQNPFQSKQPMLYSPASKTSQALSSSTSLSSSSSPALKQEKKVDYESSYARLYRIIGHTLTGIKFAKDKIPGRENVLKLKFSDSQSATEFAKKYDLKTVPKGKSKNVLVLTKTKAESLFKKLDVQTHGKTLNTPMWNKLVQELPPPRTRPLPHTTIKRS